MFDVWYDLGSGWLAGPSGSAWLDDWLVGWLAGWLAGCLVATRGGWLPAYLALDVVAVTQICFVYMKSKYTANLTGGDLAGGGEHFI